MGQWTTFDIAGEAQIDALMQEDFGPDPDPEPVEDKTMDKWSEVGPGVRDKLRELGDEPVTREMYLIPGEFSVTFSKAGRRLDYTPATGVLVFPSAQ